MKFWGDLGKCAGIFAGQSCKGGKVVADGAVLVVKAVLFWVVVDMHTMFIVVLLGELCGSWEKGVVIGDGGCSGATGSAVLLKAVLVWVMG